MANKAKSEPPMIPDLAGKLERGLEMRNERLDFARSVLSDLMYLATAVKRLGIEVRNYDEAGPESVSLVALGLRMGAIAEAGFEACDVMAEIDLDKSREILHDHY